MNPTPADNNQPNSQPNIQQPQNQGLPQLENETPMNITLYPNTESGQTNLEPEKIEPITPQPVQPTPVVNLDPVVTPEIPGTPNLNSLPPLPPLPPKPALDFGSEPKPEPITELVPSTLNPNTKKEDFFHNPANQKIAMIAGIVLGVLFVGGIVSLYLMSNKPAVVTAPTKPAAALNTTPIVKTTPAAPIVVKLTLTDYQMKIDSINTKYQNLITNNPININAPTLNIDTVRFVGDELFAISNEINELEVSDELKIFNQRLSIEFNSLVSTYDEVVRTYKASSALSLDLKNKFLLNTKSSNEKIKNTVLEIKSLK